MFFTIVFRISSCGTTPIDYGLRKTIVTGHIENYDPGKSTIGLTLNKPGLP